MLEVENTIVRRRGLRVNIKKRKHQHFTIGNIEFGLHYNYLNDRFYLTTFINKIPIVTNRQILPNENMIAGLTYQDGKEKPLGELYFAIDKSKKKSYEQSIFNLEDFESEDLRVIYFDEVLDNA